MPISVSHNSVLSVIELTFISDTSIPLIGHSRTIVGVEELKDGSLRLLIFDPSCSRKQMRQFLGDINANLMRCLRRSPNSLKAKQYQIVAVIGVLSEQEYEVSTQRASLWDVCSVNKSTKWMPNQPEYQMDA